MAAVLLTGGSGQVGTALQRLAPAGWELVAPARAELDLSDPDALARMVASRHWTWIVNCGAYTAVDKAESDADAAWAVNARAAEALAVAAAEAGIPILHVSTDYVFDGSKDTPYTEDDVIAPLGVYGASKEAGERAVRDANARHIILRTAWVVSLDGSNFIKTMLRLGAERPELRVVADQHGCPTSAADIAGTIAELLSHTDGPWGTYHFVNAGEATWHELAEAVFARAAVHGRPVPEVVPITTADFPTPARRPVNSRLAIAKLGREHGIVARPWREAVDAIVDTLLEERE